LFGNAASVLVGDFLYSRAFQMMVSVHRMRVLEVLADATNVIAEGEVLQLMNMHDPDIRKKITCASSATRLPSCSRPRAGLGAVLAQAGATSRRWPLRHAPGHRLPADRRPVSTIPGDKEQTGKNVGDDLAEGKPTLPLLYAMRHGSAEQSAAGPRRHRAGRVAHFDAILSAIVRSGALDCTTRRRAREEAGMPLLKRSPACRMAFIARLW
jgi:octaprenyl-diphosphate synthase